jgi:hypothetical protein
LAANETSLNFETQNPPSATHFSGKAAFLVSPVFLDVLIFHSFSLCNPIELMVVKSVEVEEVPSMVLSYLIDAQALLLDWHTTPEPSSVDLWECSEQMHAVFSVFSIIQVEITSLLLVSLPLIPQRIEYM